MSRFLSTGLSTLSSIRNQLTEFTTEVLNESTQEVNDPVTELSVAKKRVADLEQLLATRNSEVSYFFLFLIKKVLPYLVQNFHEESNHKETCTMANSEYLFVFQVEKLRAANSELEERAHVFEYQLRQVNERHKEAIDEKEVRNTISIFARFPWLFSAA